MIEAMNSLVSVRAKARTGWYAAKRGISLWFAICVFLCGFCASVASPSVFAQGCAMCYTSAAAAGPAAARAIDYGIIVLLTPALLLFIGIFILLIRRAAAATRESERVRLHELRPADPSFLT
jgi:hypothetical protein